MYFLVTTIFDLYQRLAWWILEKHKERPVMNTGLLVCGFCWYAIGIPLLLSPFFHFITTFVVLMIPVAPLINLLQGKPMITFGLEKPWGSTLQDQVDAERKAELRAILERSVENDIEGSNPTREPDRTDK